MFVIAICIGMVKHKLSVVGLMLPDIYDGKLQLNIVKF